MHGPSEGVSEETDEANSAVKIVGGNVFVELDPDHPGFKDEGYRSRRNEIAKIALEWNEMSMDERRTKKIPHAPYTEDEDAKISLLISKILQASKILKKPCKLLSKYA